MYIFTHKPGTTSEEIKCSLQLYYVLISFIIFIFALVTLVFIDEIKLFPEFQTMISILIKIFCVINVLLFILLQFYQRKTIINNTAGRERIKKYNEKWQLRKLKCDIKKVNNELEKTNLM